ncbi:hypothetical protein [Actinokineospora enzanensis]|uniref:hypothetical protein n=1 Tax=Actinokineospora enzanensis TaxID=155975 RepID=UPI00037F3948|nr:hypothetical protein [Actinokineospora enzanensis]
MAKVDGPSAATGKPRRWRRRVVKALVGVAVLAVVRGAVREPDGKGGGKADRAKAQAYRSAAARRRAKKRRGGR